MTQSEQSKLTVHVVSSEVPVVSSDVSAVSSPVGGVAMGKATELDSGGR
ncbi:hypothetical protein IMCC26207_105144 [Actinobacteria bacterium IMCC26207]|nr:hypothetical protein IMCC26207_105144 [Actinobacteria bacterium IMCC26207]